MKILFASDIHGSAGACRALLSRREAEGAQTLILLGDLLYHGPRNPVPSDYDPKAVAAMLNGVKERILCVRGNCDAEVDQMLLEFPALADYAMLWLDDHRAFLTHGHVFGPEHLPPLSPGDLLLSGHTHLPTNREKDGICLLNPGSVTFPKGGMPPTYLLYEDGRFSHRTLSGAEIKVE